MLRIPVPHRWLTKVNRLHEQLDRWSDAEWHPRYTSKPGSYSFVRPRLSRHGITWQVYYYHRYGVADAGRLPK